MLRCYFIDGKTKSVPESYVSQALKTSSGQYNHCYGATSTNIKEVKKH